MSSRKNVASAGSAGMIACIDIGPSPLKATSSGMKPGGALLSGAAEASAAVPGLIVLSVTGDPLV